MIWGLINRDEFMCIFRCVFWLKTFSHKYQHNVQENYFFFKKNERKG